MAGDRKEILGIDLLRFLAATMVVFNHLGFWVNQIGEMLAPVSRFGWIGVEIFFVISGFVIAYSSENASAFSFFRSRFVRLMPGIWVFAVAALPTAYYVYHLSFPKLLVRFTKTATLYPLGPWLDGILWTLPVEVSFYFIVFLVIFFGAYRMILRIAAFIGLYSSAYWSVYMIAAMLGNDHFMRRMIDISWTWYGQLSLVHYGCFFALGVFLWSMTIKKTRSHINYLAAIFIVGGLTEIAATNSTKFNDTNIMQAAAVPAAIWIFSIGFIVIAARYNNFVARKVDMLSPRIHQFIRQTGKFTYPLYLLHRPVAFIVIYSLTQIMPARNSYWYAGFAAAFIVASIVTTWIEPWLQRLTLEAIDEIHNKVVSPRLRAFSARSDFRRRPPTGSFTA